MWSFGWDSGRAYDGGLTFYAVGDEDGFGGDGRCLEVVKAEMDGSLGREDFEQIGFGPDASGTAELAEIVGEQGGKPALIAAEGWGKEGFFESAETVVHVHAGMVSHHCYLWRVGTQDGPNPTSL